MARWRKKKQKLRKTDPMTSKLRFTWKVASLERLAFPDRHLADPAAWPVFQCPSLDFGKRAMGILRNVKATESPKKKPPKSLIWITWEQHPNWPNWTNNPSPSWWHLMGTSHWNCVKDDLEATYYIPLINGLWSYLLRLATVPASNPRTQHRIQGKYQGISLSSKTCERVGLGFASFLLRKLVSTKATSKDNMIKVAKRLQVLSRKKCQRMKWCGNPTKRFFLEASKAVLVEGHGLFFRSCLSKWRR